MDKITQEVAAAEFDRWAEEWGIDTDREYMDEEDRQSFDNTRHRLIRSIRKGALTVSEDGATIDLNCIAGEGLTFEVPKGSAWLTMDQHKSSKDFHKVFSYMGAMTGKPAKFFSNMDGRDLKVAQDVTVLFMG